MKIKIINMHPLECSEAHAYLGVGNQEDGNLKSSRTKSTISTIVKTPSQQKLRMMAHTCHPGYVRGK
jgi:hypothetical protein